MFRELTDHQAVIVDRQPDQFQPRHLRRLYEPAGAGILHADRHVTGREQGVRDLGHALAGAGDYGDSAGLRGRPPAPVQVVGENGAQPRVPARLGIVELVERRGLGGGPHRLRPLAARKGAKIRPARGQVEARRPGRSLGRPHRARIPVGAGIGRPADPGRRTSPSGQVPLRDQQAVCLRHGPPGNSQVGRERAAGRHGGPEGQPPIPDGGADRRSQPQMQRAGAGRGQIQQRLPRQIGLRSCHAIGS
jgi:hypothetical protein